MTPPPRVPTRTPVPAPRPVRVTGEMLRRGMPGLWRTVLDATGCPVATARILAELANARDTAPLLACEILPAGGDPDSGSGARWELVLTHAAPKAPSGHRDGRRS